MGHLIHLDADVPLLSTCPFWKKNKISFTKMDEHKLHWLKSYLATQGLHSGILNDAACQNQPAKINESVLFYFSTKSFVFI